MGPLGCYSKTARKLKVYLVESEPSGALKIFPFATPTSFRSIS